jgi:mannose-1-phosphate guanylyltransferase
MKPKVALVILAGGGGRRFWPLSTVEHPKQFLDLEGVGRTLLQRTYDRLRGINGGTRSVYVQTTARYEPLVRSQLPELPLDHVFAEPVTRDTGPAIALAVLEMRARMGDVPMAVFPSDHRVGDDEAFARALDAAVTMAVETRGIITLGMTPDRPATGFGYVKRGAPVGAGFRVESFVEKPDRRTAAAYVRSGRYSWNAGIFVFCSGVMYEELAANAPDVLRPLEAAFDTGSVHYAYGRLPKRSLDYAVLEKTERAYVVPASFGWDDLGDWSALERVRNVDEALRNTVVGHHVGIETEGTIVYNDDEDGVIATLGVRDMVVVRRGGVVLLVAKDRVQDIKELTERVELQDLDLAAVHAGIAVAEA